MRSFMHGGRAQDVPLVLVLATLPLQWAELVRIPNATIKVVHLAAFLLISNTALRVLPRVQLNRVGPELFFWLAYAVYISFIALSTTWAPDPTRGFVVIARQLYYALVGFSIYLTLATRDGDQRAIAPALYWGALGGFFIFILATMAAAARDPAIGQQFLQGVATGNVVRLKFALDSFFNAVGDDPTDYKKSIRAVILGLLVILGGLLAATQPYAAARLGRGRVRVAQVILLAGLAALVLFSLSRSVWLNVFAIVSAGLILTLALGGLRRRHLYQAVAMAIAATVLLAAYGDKLMLIVYARGIQDTEAYAGRISINAYAIESIDRRPLLGTGVGALFRQEGQQDIHLFFLKAGYQAGALALMLSILLYAVFAGLLGRYVWLLVRNRHYISRAAESQAMRLGWILPLASFPVLRVFYTPDAFEGLLDWVPIGLVLGCMAHFQKNLRIEPVKESRP